MESSSYFVEHLETLNNKSKQCQFGEKTNLYRHQMKPLQGSSKFRTGLSFENPVHETFPDQNETGRAKPTNKSEFFFNLETIVTIETTIETTIVFNH